jgi:hypothetical protein
MSLRAPQLFKEMQLMKGKNGMMTAQDASHHSRAAAAASNHKYYLVLCGHSGLLGCDSYPTHKVLTDIQRGVVGDMVVHTVVVGIVSRQIFPLAACAYDIEDGIDHLAHIQLKRMTWSIPFPGAKAAR